MANQNIRNQLKLNIEGQLPEKLDLLQAMVNINSFTANPQGVNKLGDLTADAFAELGFEAERIQAADFLYGKHLILTRHGRSQNQQPTPTIGLISHLDTVYPLAEEIDNDFHWRVSGRRIYGPGVYDIKGGTVMILLVLSALRDADPALFDSVTWVVLLNAAEEALVPDFGRLCQDRLRENPLAALVFEGGEPNGNGYKLVVARKGMARYHVTVEGKAAHAGTSHHHGANAILQMSEVIQRIAAYTDYDHAITFNVGTITGGTVINRVPHHASAFVEMRAYSPVVFTEGINKMVALNEFTTVRSANGGYPCRVNVNILGQWEPWAPNEGSTALFNLWQRTGLDLGKALDAQERGGLSDGNWTWKQVPTLDGLGPDGGNAHCSERADDGSKDQEYVLATSFAPKALLNCLALVNLVNGYYAGK
ncbi:MAG: M20/M25/M40 family metallo-hydrolase [Candidatus Promineifilaceae bacterium]|nr:M20/M25/M40 family metallo-hydrolase [Candidatus Promineifilaceae bacterium]